MGKLTLMFRKGVVVVVVVVYVPRGTWTDGRIGSARWRSLWVTIVLDIMVY